MVYLPECSKCYNSCMFRIKDMVHRAILKPFKIKKKKDTKDKPKKGKKKNA